MSRPMDEGKERNPMGAIIESCREPALASLCNNLLFFLFPVRKERCGQVRGHLRLDVNGSRWLINGASSLFTILRPYKHTRDKSRNGAGSFPTEPVAEESLLFPYEGRGMLFRRQTEGWKRKIKTGEK